MWQADRRHGPGVMVTQAGVCYQGTFQADKMVVSTETHMCPEPHLPALGPQSRTEAGQGWMGQESGF